MKGSSPEILPLEMEKLEQLLDRVQASVEEPDYELLRALVESYVFLTQAIEEKGTRIAELRKLLFGSASEKTKKVLEEVLGPTTSSQEDSQPAHKPKRKAKRKGHGRNGALAYRRAQKVKVPHASLRSGDACPLCPKGKVYKLKKPRRLVRLQGQAPIQARIYELERLRCNLCGEIFTAQAPEGVGKDKYDATSAAMIALLRYGSGMPFHRLENLQGSLGIPLPDATQWDLVKHNASRFEPVYEQLIREAAQGEVLHNDDTRMPILEVIKEVRQQTARGSPPDRTGMFTSGIVSIQEGLKIALFFTGRKHAGENLATVLAERLSQIGPPLQMCDGLDRNLPKGLPEPLQVIVSNCLAHARRQVIKVADSFPEECEHVLRELAKVYKIDAQAKNQALSPEERLVLHQQRSGPVLAELRTWLQSLLEQNKVEPNSGLGKAIHYLLKRWDRLTLFLTKPGAPLDNNICERALKMAIRHRNNSLFYKTENGAKVGDLYMSLIATCQLAAADPLDYLTTLHKRTADAAHNPADWMPWNYHLQLEPAIEP